MGSGGGVSAVTAIGAGVGTAEVAGFGGAPAPLTSISAMTLPLATLSPIFTEIAVTVPAASAGTSMVALSDSRTNKGCSFSMTSPTLISTSITGTSA